MTLTTKHLERRRKTKDPCPGCRLHRSLCICEFIPTIDIATRICLVIHYKELKRTTNTGQLITQSLRNSEMHVRGVRDETTLDFSAQLSANYQTLFLFPSEEASELNEAFLKKIPRPIQLIVPDGNWRQASKVHSRHPELRSVPRVKLSLKSTTSHHLRAEHMSDGLATLEAVAFALGIIEGPEVMNLLLRLYRAKLENTLIGRGTFHRNP